MKKILLFVLLTFIISCSDSNDLKGIACIISEDFVKEYLNNPEEADFSTLRCNTEIENGQYVVLSYVMAKNSFGVKSKIIYKVWLTYNGGNDVDIKNWKCEKMILEENGQQTLIDNRVKPVNDTIRKIIGKIDDIECVITEESPGVFARIETSKKLTKNQIEKFISTYNITTNLLYFYLPGMEERGKEYASVTGDMIFVY